MRGKGTVLGLPHYPNRVLFSGNVIGIWASLYNARTYTRTHTPHPPHCMPPSSQVSWSVSGKSLTSSSCRCVRRCSMYRIHL